jgi:hypothetical protein
MSFNKEWSKLKKKLLKNEILNKSELQKLGYYNTKNLVKDMLVIAKVIVKLNLEDYDPNQTARGYQTSFLHDSRYGFALKPFLEWPSTPTKGAIPDYAVALKCGGGLVTPSIFLRDGEKIKGLVALAITPCNRKSIKKEGQNFVDSLLNLYEKNMEQGFFDGDLILDNFGFKDGKILNLDYGRCKDLWDEKTYESEGNLHWNMFHMGIHKFRETSRDLNQIDFGLGDYFLGEIKNKYGIEFNENAMQMYRGSEDFIPFANQLRKITKIKRGKNIKSVYPFLGNPVNEIIFNRLKARFEK